MTPGEFLNQMARIGTNLRRNMESIAQGEIAYGNVSEVNREDRTINVRIGDGGLVISDISLSSIPGGNASVLLYPSIGSLVILGFPYKQYENAFVLQFTEIDEISVQYSFDNSEDSIAANSDSIDVKRGDYSCNFTKDGISLLCSDGGSIEIKGNSVTFNGGKLGGMVDINKLTTSLNQMITWLNTHTHTSAALGSPTSPPVAPANSFSSSNYVNDKVKQ